MPVEEILSIFFENNIFDINDGEIYSGSWFQNDYVVKLHLLKLKKAGKIIVEKGRRITARHISQLEKAGIKNLEVPA